MGIPRLNTFVEENFHGWKRQVVRGPLVIDGSNIRHHLYHFDWSRGGQLHEFYDRVIWYYKGLLDRGVEPIVVLDGIDHTGEKHATIIKRHKLRISTIRNYILNEEDKPEKSSQGIFPALGSNVYVQALSDLRICYVVVDGEADDALVRISNYYNCPLLSSDSDFYMYKLNAGYIKMDQLRRERDCIVADVYHYEDFCDEFHFQDYNCRLAIPALVGNDVIPSVVDTRNYEEFFDRAALQQFADGDLIRSTINYISSFESLPSFLNKIRSTFSKGRVTKITENCQKSLEIYNSDITYRIEDIQSLTELCTKNGEDIPQWVISSFRTGHFSKFLFCMLVIGRYIFDTYIDNPHRESCVILSRPIRQVIYGVLGLDSAIEHLRVEHHLSEEEVPSLNDHLPSLREISSLSQSDGEDLVCRILGCDKRVINAQEEHLKLVLASTVFWCRESQPPRHVVESLLLCMLVCFYRPHLLFRHYETAIQFRSSDEWIANLHSFAQWQCCYKDAISLNELFMCPYRVICPSQLFNGKLVMHLSQLGGISADVVQSFRIHTGQYFWLLDTIFNQVTHHKSRAIGGHMSAQVGARSHGSRPPSQNPAGRFSRGSAEWEEEPLSWRSRGTGDGGVRPVSTASRSHGRGGYTKHSANDSSWHTRDADGVESTTPRPSARGHGSSSSKPFAKGVEDSADSDGFVPVFPVTKSRGGGSGSAKRSAKVAGDKRKDGLSPVPTASHSGGRGGHANLSAGVDPASVASGSHGHDGSTKAAKDKRAKEGVVPTTSKSRDHDGRPTKKSSKVPEGKVAANEHTKGGPGGPAKHSAKVTGTKHTEDGDSILTAAKSHDPGGLAKHSAKVTAEDGDSTPTATRSRRRGGKRSAKVTEDKRAKDTGNDPGSTPSKSPHDEVSTGKHSVDASSNSRSRDQDGLTKPASKSRSPRQNREGTRGHGSTPSTSTADNSHKLTNQTHNASLESKQPQVHTSQKPSSGGPTKDAPSPSSQPQNPSGRRSGYRGRGIKQQSRSSQHRDSGSHEPKSGEASQSRGDGGQTAAQAQEQSGSTRRGNNLRPVQSRQQSQRDKSKSVTRPDTAESNVHGGPAQEVGQQPPPPAGAVPKSSKGHRGRRRHGRGHGTAGSGVVGQEGQLPS